MCRPTTLKNVCTVQQEHKEMESIQVQLHKLIGFNPVVITSRGLKRARIAEAPTEWILWQHQVHDERDRKGLKDWQGHTSEAAHFFRSTAAACDTKHVPCPSKTFTAPMYKNQQHKGHYKPKSADPLKQGYSLFQQGIQAEWEDPKNATGGAWFIRQYMEPSVLDSFWKNLVAGVVDQSLVVEELKKNVWRPRHLRASSPTKEIFDHINGIRVDDKTHRFSQRAMYKIEIWMDTTDTKICEQVREWMLATMTSCTSVNRRTLRTHWKSFAPKMDKAEDDEKSETTSATDAASCSSSSSLGES